MADVGLSPPCMKFKDLSLAIKSMDSETLSHFIAEDIGVSTAMARGYKLAKDWVVGSKKIKYLLFCWADQAT